MGTTARANETSQGGSNSKGSRYQIQSYVNGETAKLDRAIKFAINTQSQLGWVSPLKSDNYKEYKDAKFLGVLGLERYKGQLRDFWPSGGPRWDALAMTYSNSAEIILIEAKSHIPELYVGRCKATSYRSLKAIDVAIRQTQEWLSVESDKNWRGLCNYEIMGRTRANGCLYQTANRIAHLYFLREIIGVKAWLVNVYFVNDPYRKTTAKEWNSALSKAKEKLGISTVPFTRDVLLPAIS